MTSVSPDLSKEEGDEVAVMVKPALPKAKGTLKRMDSTLFGRNSMSVEPTNT